MRYLHYNRLVMATLLVVVLLVTFTCGSDKRVAVAKEKGAEEIAQKFGREVATLRELRRPMVNPVDLPLYTIHMDPELPSTWVFGCTAPPLPGGFFGPGSDPWSGSIACVGDPFDPKGVAPTADLVVRHEKIEWIPNPEKRYGPAEIPRKFTLRCEMVELSERGIEPITVTYDGGQRPEKWDVHIGLAKDHPGGGLIQITHINPDGNGGLADIEIAVKVAFKFTRGDRELVAVSDVEWLSETNHSFVRWLDPKMMKRVYVSPEMQGTFIPATSSIGGWSQMTAGKSCSRAVSHSFILPPREGEIKGAWGTIPDIWQFPERIE